MSAFARRRFELRLGELERANQRLQEQLAKPRQEIEKLRKQLEQALRAARRAKNMAGFPTGPSVYPFRDLVQSCPGSRCGGRIGIVLQCLLERSLSRVEMASGHIGHSQVILKYWVIGNFLHAFL